MGLEFTETLFELWEKGYRSCAASGQIEEASESSSHVAFLSKLCENSKSHAVCPGRGGDEALSIICGLITSCVQPVLAPRARLTCLELLQLLVPLASQALHSKRLLKVKP